MPKRPSVLASQATQFTGLPSAAAPAPVLMILPFFSTTMPQVAKSSLRGLTAVSPKSSTPQEALSAMVS